MELWVRSQDKLALTKVNSIGIEYDKKLVGYGNICVKLGEYKTKERALEVLDEIQGKITQNEVLKTMMPSVSTIKGYEEKFGELFKKMVYQMPEE
jgi:hypothetical protein